MVLLRAARQILPARLAETCLPLTSSCIDPLCVVSTAIKQFVCSPHLNWGWSAHEIWRPFFCCYRAGCASCFCTSAEPFTLTPQIPKVTSFSLTAHHLLTHRLTSLTLQREGVAASMKRWLRGNRSVCMWGRYLSKFKQDLCGFVWDCSWSRCRWIYNARTPVPVYGIKAATVVYCLALWQGRVCVCVNVILLRHSLPRGVIEGAEASFP